MGILYEPIQGRSAAYSLYFFGLTKFEPDAPFFVACVDMLRKGYEIGIQMGCTNEAFCNLYFLIPRMIEAGTNLDVIRKEIVFFQKMATTQ